jgi:Type I phosphodiesterase / nucleotide pyrophosphatase
MVAGWRLGKIDNTLGNPPAPWSIGVSQKRNGDSLQISAAEGESVGMVQRYFFRPIAVAAGLLLFSACLLITHSIKTGGEQKLAKAAPPPRRHGPHVIIFALDGAVPDRLMEAIHSGDAPNVARLLGKDEGDGLFEHAYAAPNALSVLPSSTIADWSSIFTGKTPAQDGVTGDEWFDRESATFLAPVPVSVTNITDDTKTVADDLVGKELKTPTLYELLKRRTYVSCSPSTGVRHIIQRFRPRLWRPHRAFGQGYAKRVRPQTITEWFN